MQNPETYSIPPAWPSASDSQLRHVVRAMERGVGHWLFSQDRAYRDGLVIGGSSKATANRRTSILRVVLKEGGIPACDARDARAA